MAALGEDFRGGWFRRLYAPSNPAGLGVAIAFAVVLLVVKIVNRSKGWYEAGLTTEQGT